MSSRAPVYGNVVGCSFVHAFFHLLYNLELMVVQDDVRLLLKLSGVNFFFIGHVGHAIMRLAQVSVVLRKNLSLLLLSLSTARVTTSRTTLTSLVHTIRTFSHNVFLKVVSSCRCLISSFVETSKRLDNNAIWRLLEHVHAKLGCCF